MDKHSELLRENCLILWTNMQNYYMKTRAFVDKHTKLLCGQTYKTVTRELVLLKTNIQNCYVITACSSMWTNIQNCYVRTACSSMWTNIQNCYVRTACSSMCTNSGRTLLVGEPFLLWTNIQNRYVRTHLFVEKHTQMLRENPSP